MSKIQAIPDGNGGYIYPVTIANAIIDPNTGEPITLGGNDMEYTIQVSGGTVLHADNNGNFTLTAQDLGAAPATHPHEISDINNLQDTLDGKSDTNHTHAMITSISDGVNSVSGAVTVSGTGNVRVSQSGGNISISITPYTTDIGNNIVDSNSSNSVPIGLFTGTEAQWEAFKQTSTFTNGTNLRYLVFIRS